MASRSGRGAAPATVIRKTGPVVARAAFALVPSQASVGTGRGQRGSDDDDVWVDKQERAFVAWINAHIEDATRIPAHVPAATHYAEAAVNAARTSTLAILAKLEPDVAAKHIAMRDDLDLVADLAVRDRLIQMTLAYHPAWLLLGLKAVFGPAVAPATDRLSLATFVNMNMLQIEQTDPETGYRTVGAPKHPARYAQYRSALQEHFLLRFLALVLFLDKAKAVPLIPANPLLFNKASEWKSSRELLTVFAQRYLKGEGDLVRHLTYMSFAVQWVQPALDELDFRVANIAVDLRDGARLARLVTHLAQDKTLMAEIRYPATTRAHCVGNIRAVMTALAGHGVALGEVRAGLLTPEDIVDGHREKTLGLLWRIILHWQVDLLLNEDLLQREIACIRRDVARQRRERLTLGGALGAPTVDLDEQLDASVVSYFQSSKLSLLLQWCQAVCALFDVPVHNFSASFSDGRALCYLIHYYHPTQLPLSVIHTVTTKAPAPVPVEDDVPDENVVKGRVVRAVALTFSPGNRPGVLTAEKVAQNNERANFREVQRAVAAMGGVPFHLEAGDLSGGVPDEKSVITLVAYLCTRMLGQRNEIRAAKAIQFVWRQARPRAVIKPIAKAVPVPVVAVVAKKAPSESVVRAATTVQAAYRGLQARRAFARMSAAARVLQRHWRNLAARRQAKVAWTIAVAAEAAAAEEAARLEAETAARVAAEEAARLEAGTAARLAAETVARLAAEEAARLEAETAARLAAEEAARLEAETAARVAAEEAARLEAETVARVAAEEAARLEAETAARVAAEEATRLEAETAARLAAEEAARLEAETAARVAAEEAARLEAESAARLAAEEAARLAAEEAARLAAEEAARLEAEEAARLAAEEAARLEAETAARVAAEEAARLAAEKAATVVQAAWRGAMARRAYRRDRAAVVAAQQLWRAHRAGRAGRSAFVAQRAATQVLQVRFRAMLAGRLARARWLSMRASASRIQCWWRAVAAGRHVRAKFTALRAATVVLQTHVRAVMEARQAQAAWLAMRAAAIVLQGRWRAVLAGRQARTAFARAKGAVLVLQRSYRAHLAAHAERRAHLLAARREAAAAIIQSAVRGQQARLHYAAVRAGIVRIQSVWRGWRVRRAGSAAVDAVRARVKAANARYSLAMTLGSRTTAALEILLTSKSLSHVMKACYHLEVSTRLSASCCVRLAEHHAIPILLILIRSCNRSQPHMEILRLALNVLRNLATCPATVQRAFEAEGAVEVLSELMQIYRDSTDIFVRSLQVLAILASDPARLSVLKAKNTKEVTRLRSVVALIEQRYAPAASSSSARPTGRSTLGGGQHATAASAAAAREAAARSAELLAAATQLKHLLATS